MASSDTPAAPEVKDEKFIVFKREDLQRWMDDVQRGTVEGGLLGMALDDAVVIRTRDIFAAPVLHLYAAQMEVAAQLAYDADAAAELRWIGAYFKRRAIEADKGDHKFPD